VQLFELLSAAVFEIRRRPSKAFEEAATDLLAMASCLTDSDLAAIMHAPAARGDAHGWRDFDQTKRNLRAAASFLQSLFQSGFKPPATFDAIDEVCRPAYQMNKTSSRDVDPVHLDHASNERAWRVQHE
jgi:hypothetical protein